jgi:hydrogenase nickel incorporation protein HypA/HybF
MLSSVIGMHEWALAEAIVMSVVEYARRRNASGVRKVIVSLGELQAIDKEILSFALSELRKESPLPIKEFVLEDEEAVFRCRACGYEWRLKDMEGISEDVREYIHFVPEVVHTYLRCPRCGSPDFEVVSGRGVRIKEVILE